MSKLINVASFKYRADTESPWQELTLTGEVDPLNGVPAGGTTGQLLAKLSGTDYDTVWVDDGLTILSYGNSTWADFIAAYTAQKVVYCRASSNSNPASGSQTRLAFMAYVNNAENPTEVEFQYYRSVSSHSDSQQGDQVFVYKLNKNTGWSVTTRNAFTKIVAGSGLSSSYADGKLTLTNDRIQALETFGYASRSSSASAGNVYGLYDPNTGLVIVNFYFNSSSNVGTTKVFTIPERYRPSSEKYGTASIAQTSDYTKIYLSTASINANGQIGQGVTSSCYGLRGLIVYAI